MEENNHKKPKPHQLEAIDAAKAYYQYNDRGQLIMACGTGKTLTSLWIAKAMNAHTLLVIIPSLQLQAQSILVWTNEATSLNYSLMAVGSDKSVRAKGDTQVTTSVDVIEQFLRKTGPKIIFSTYQSGGELFEACRNTNTVFDFAIIDEAHRTCGHDEKHFSKVVFSENVIIKKRLFMTATPKFFEGDSIVSMDNEALYGKRFYTLSTERAIEQEILCDYKVIVEYVEQPDDIRLVSGKNNLLKTGGHNSQTALRQEWVMAVAIQQAIERYKIKRVITYHKNVAQAKNFEALMSKTNTISTFHINHRHSIEQRNKTIADFKSAQKGLITNARLLSEGMDVPEVDCVVFVDAKNSAPDVVQIIGRALRRYEGKALGYVIIPVYVSKEGIINESEFKKITQALVGIASNDKRLRKQLEAPNRTPNPKEDVLFFRQAAIKFDYEKLSQAISLRVWKRTRILSYAPYSEAKKYAAYLLEKYGIYGVINWVRFFEGYLPNGEPAPERPPSDIPKRPEQYYREEFEGYKDFFDRIFISYEEAKKLAKENKITSIQQWTVFTRKLNNPKIPIDIYNFPEFNSAYEFFEKNPPNKEWRDFEQAKEFAKSLVRYGINSKDSWVAYTKGTFAEAPPLPSDIPQNPQYIYRDVWESWPDWFGKEKQEPSAYLHFLECRKIAIDMCNNYGITDGKKWVAWATGKLDNMPPFPANVPEYPYRTYKTQWRDWGFFLGLKGR